MSGRSRPKAYQGFGYPLAALLVAALLGAGLAPPVATMALPLCLGLASSRLTWSLTPAAWTLGASLQLPVVIHAYEREPGAALSLSVLALTIPPTLHFLLFCAAWSDRQSRRAALGLLALALMMFSPWSFAHPLFAFGDLFPGAGFPGLLSGFALCFLLLRYAYPGVKRPQYLTGEDGARPAATCARAAAALLLIFSWPLAMSTLTPPEKDALTVYRTHLPLRDGPERWGAAVVAGARVAGRLGAAETPENAVLRRDRYSDQWWSAVAEGIGHTLNVAHVNGQTGGEVLAFVQAETDGSVTTVYRQVQPIPGVHRDWAPRLVNGLLRDPSSEPTTGRKICYEALIAWPWLIDLITGRESIVVHASDVSTAGTGYAAARDNAVRSIARLIGAKAVVVAEAQPPEGVPQRHAAIDDRQQLRARPRPTSTPERSEP